MQLPAEQLHSGRQRHVTFSPCTAPSSSSSSSSSPRSVRSSSRRPLSWRQERWQARRQQAINVCCSADALAASASLPLSDKRILVTAPRQYAGKLAAKLLAAGARPLWLPTIEIVALRDPSAREELLAALENLSPYQHIAFPSKNAINAVLGTLEERLGSQQAAVAHIEASGAKCWALGATGHTKSYCKGRGQHGTLSMVQAHRGADAEVLIQAGFREVHRPKEPSTQGLVAELKRRGEAEGQRVLCPVPRVLAPLLEPPVVPTFLAALEKAGAEPVRVDAYETGVGCTPASCSAEWELLMEGEVQAIAFSSTAEAQGLVHLMGGAGFVHRAIRLHSVLLAAHGKYTAAGVAAVLGVPVTCVSQDSSTFDGLVTALGEGLSVQPGPPAGLVKALALREKKAAIKSEKIKMHAEKRSLKQQRQEKQQGDAQ